MAEKIATREAYGNALVEFGVNEKIVVFDADLSKSTKTASFQKKYPDRFFNMGIAEANMMCAAAGMATCGKIAFASTFAIFAAGRACEQVRNSICYPNLNVKIGATHSGISVGEDGASHQMLEDISNMRVLPNMTVISPSDGVETRLAVKAAIEHYGPVYLRLGRLSVPVIYDETYKFELGKGVELRTGSDVTIVATGLLVHEALKAYEMLKEKGISARVINIHTIKPIDDALLEKCARETGAIVTAEEHNVIGGLGSAVCESVAGSYPVPVLRIGTQDKFGRSGKPELLLKAYELTGEDIAKKAEAVIAMK